MEFLDFLKELHLTFSSQMECTVFGLETNQTQLKMDKLQEKISMELTHFSWLKVLESLKIGSEYSQI